MKIDNDIVYSNDLCSAFLTEIVKDFEEIHPTGYLGRTAMQKLAYFAKVLDVPFPCSFGIYTYGPYSDAITFSIESMLADEVLLDRSSTPKYSNYRTGKNSNELLNTYQNEVKPYKGTIKQIVKTLGGFKPNDLELIATLHFVARRQRQRTTSLNRQAIIAEFKSIKKNKFSDGEIGIWYDALQDAKLI